jgi:hypothetical protein
VNWEFGGSGGLTVFLEQSIQALHRKISPAVKTPILTPRVSNNNDITEQRMLRPIAISHNRMSTCNLSTYSEKTTSIRLKHLLIPVDTEDHGPTTYYPIDRVVDTEAPTVLSKVVSSLTSLHTSEDSCTV